MSLLNRLRKAALLKLLWISLLTKALLRLLLGVSPLFADSLLGLLGLLGKSLLRLLKALLKLPGIFLLSQTLLRLLLGVTQLGHSLLGLLCESLCMLQCHDHLSLCEESRK